MKIILHLLKMLCFVVLFDLLSSSVLALTPLGPPVVTLDKGEYAIGFGYSQSKSDMEAHMYGSTFAIEDVELDAYMVNFIFGLNENVEFQIDLGISDYDYDNFSSSDDFAGGFAIKTTLSKSDKIEWGAAFTMHWYEANSSKLITGMPWTEEAKWTEIQVAFGPSYKNGVLRLYGGPFLNWVDGDAKVMVGNVDVSGEIQHESIFGGFVGTQFDVTDNAVLGFEYQLTSSGDAITVRFLWKF